MGSNKRLVKIRFGPQWLTFYLYGKVAPRPQRRVWDRVLSPLWAQVWSHVEDQIQYQARKENHG